MNEIILCVIRNTFNLTSLLLDGLLHWPCLVPTIPKRYDTFKSCGIGDKFITHINGCRVKRTPGIKPL